jgi:putative photosynthetic complex assembly protein
MNTAAHSNAMSTPKPTAPDTFPRWVLWATAALLSFTLIAVALVRITGNGPDQLAAATVNERLLRFEDVAGGGVAVIDGDTGKLLTTVTGEQGFFRGAIRALARDRIARKIGSQEPFKLIARADGRLTLFDPVSGQRVDLESFGPTNAAVFAQFLNMQPQR